MATSARVLANSKDREHNCGLFLDVQTEMEHTPPLPLWCGGAARLWVFFFTQREEEGSSGTGSTGRFPWWEALLACHRFTEEKEKKKPTMNAAEKKPTLSVRDPRACSYNLSTGFKNLRSFSLSERDFNSKSYSHCFDSSFL